MLFKPKNPYACAPKMRKGGVHQTSKKRKRQDQRREIKHSLAILANNKGHQDFPVAFVNFTAR